ncbi:MAG: YggT family protein [Pseudomonadales bacterium]
MGVVADIGTFLVQTLLTFFLIAVIVRLLLQVARADFYNPISQFIVKLTNPLLLPLRRFIPGLGGIDFAAVVLALLVQLLATTVLLLLQGFSPINPLYMIMWGLIGILSLVLNIYLFTVLASIVVSWVAPYSDHPAVLLLRQFTEPVMAPFRKLVPSIGGIDISPILLFISIQILQIVLGHAAQAVSLPSRFVLGV